jgi:chemotaxis protein MotB
MAARRKKQAEEGAPGQGWMVTFSDCMTLLLCFFVMLLTFSAFDQNKFARFAGALQLMDYHSLFPPDDTLVRALVPPPPQNVDRTPEGSETPTEEFLQIIDKPQKSMHLNDPGAFRSRKVFYLPSAELFWAEGSSLTPSGKQKLALIGELMKLVPSRVVVREVGSGGRPRSDLAGLHRCHAVTSFLAGRHVNEELLNVSASHAAPVTRGGCIEITLLKQRSY